MYESYFGLTELPFNLTPNANYIYLSPSQREALSTLQYGLFAAKPLTVMIGEAGTGKTTLIRAALDSDRCANVRAVYLENPALGPNDFVRMLAMRFELGDEVGDSKTLLLERLRKLLLDRRAHGEITALVVDEAQSLSTALLEEIRLLANIETTTTKLLPLALAGQPELAERLEAPELRQLKQRVTLRCELKPFDVQDTANYIAKRVRTAGGSPRTMFSQEAVVLIHERAQGIARSINVICDNALLCAMGVGRTMVDRALVDDVCRDLRLLSGTSTSRSRDEAAVEPAVTPQPMDTSAVEARPSLDAPAFESVAAPRRRFAGLRLRARAAERLSSTPQTRVLAE